VVRQVNRDSHNDKLRDFVRLSSIMVADVMYLNKLAEKNIIIRLVLKHKILITQSVLFATFLLNILILYAWRANPDHAVIMPDTSSVSWYPTAFLVLSIIHIILSFCVFLAYFAAHPPSVRATFGSIPILGNIVVELPVFKAIFPTPTSFRTEFSIFSFGPLYHLIFLTMSVLGYVSNGYCFGFHLLHIIIGNDILERAIQAVTKNGKSLLWVSSLMVIFIYIYSLLGFAFLRSTYEEEKGEWCGTAFQCFVTSLRLGLIYGGGIAEALLPGIDSGKFSGQTFYDLSFFVIITTIGLNVVFGIIIDTFSELRDQKFQIAEAMESECFICGLKKQVFEQNQVEFRHHYKNEHSMWNYLYFMIYLNQKDPTEYSSHEDYVAETLKDGTNVSQFFPVGCAHSLANVSDTDAVEGKIDELLSKFADLERKLSLLSAPVEMQATTSTRSIYATDSQASRGNSTLNTFTEPDPSYSEV